MRLLLDSNLSHRVAVGLRAAGFDAEHVRDHRLHTPPIARSWSSPVRRDMVVVSEDTDFGQLLAEQRVAAPSFVLIRTYEPMTPSEQVEVLAANLPTVVGDLDTGSIVVLERTRMRVRRLPVLPPIPGKRAE